MSVKDQNVLKTLPLLEPIGQELQQVLDKIRSSARIELDVLDEALAYVVAAGGKLIRPALAITVCNIYVPTDEKALSLASSVEMLHTATLVHDDLIDGARRRRGNPTIHTLLNPTSAVLLGDYLFAQAAMWAAETDNIRVVHIFSETLMIIVGGELRQQWAQFDLERANDDYYERIYGKTAALFAAACEAAGELGGAPQAEVRALREYGRLLGLAFQIVDDVLDYVGDEGRLGKPVGGDLRNGNITLPVILYLRDYDVDHFGKRLFEDHKLSEAEVDEMVRRVIASPALGDSLTTARALVEEAKDALAVLPPSVQVDRLRDLADYVVERRV